MRITLSKKMNNPILINKSTISILSKLASSLNRRDELPNKILAKEISESKDKKAVKELIENLNNKNKNIQSDCIKVLYEIGERNADLISEYDKEYILLLENKNNRLVWGAMTALDYIASVNPDRIYKNLTAILAAADKGSVITNDHAINILIKLAADKKFKNKTMSILLDRLKSCATNQLPMYAENALPVITDKYKIDFIKVLYSRLGDIDKETKIKRVEKVINKLKD